MRLVAKCTKSFHMSKGCGGNRVFTRGLEYIFDESDYDKENLNTFNDDGFHHSLSEPTINKHFKVTKIILGD